MNIPSPTSTSPRHLVLRHARRLLANQARLSDPTAAPPPETDPALHPVGPGYEQLLSFYAPSLEAGPYTVTATQTVHAPTNDPDLVLETKQEFTVKAPRFSLPDGAVHSTYPPQGHGDLVETLPHMVFNDAHLPWEREATSKKDAPDYDRNRVPWLAVLVFTLDELDATPPGLKKSATLAVGTTAGEIWRYTNTATPIDENSAERIEENEKIDAIFVKPSLFTSLFSGDGVADVERYKFLAHARNINTSGMAEAGISDTGVFSVVVSHRIGPIDITQPSPVIVHLVSLEGIEEMTFPLPDTAQYVAMASLYSWTYTCLPPKSLNVFQAFQNIGNGLGLLRPSDKTIGSAASLGPFGPRLAARLRDGYTLTKYRAQTGEVTVALMRGAFSPTRVQHPLTENWTNISNSGSDFQILDQEVGIMDITYSAAWQLGKTQAMADRTFTTALSRLRNQVYDAGVNAAKIEALRSIGGHKTREETLGSLVDSLQTLSGLCTEHGHRLNRPDGMLGRWRRETLAIPDLTFGGANVTREVFAGHARVAARGFASTTATTNNPTTATKETEADAGAPALYDEFNTPSNIDWVLVLKWVLDRMFLVGIPAHYLIPDPSHLPAESLRFYSIDANWVDAYIDGALSIANHSVDDSDTPRAAIKAAINDYITHKHDVLQYTPQIPTHGFLMRSELVRQFPDLVITTSPEPLDGRAPILRHENIDSNVMLCLFDRVPGSPEFSELTLGQPPHQQSFAAAARITPELFETNYLRVYTVKDPDDTDRADGAGNNIWHKDGIDPETQKPDPRPPVFLWGERDEIRTLIFPAWAEDVFDTIKDYMTKLNNKWFTDTKPGAALCGIQLNNPIYQLEVFAAAPADALSSLIGTTPSTHSTPRTLALLDKPKHTREPLGIKPPVYVPPVNPPWESGAPTSGLPQPRDRKRLTDLGPLTPPPYHRRTGRTPVGFRPAGWGPLVLPTFAPTPGPAQPPIFKYTITPAAAAGPIPCNVPLQDLIFGVVLQSGAHDNFKLRQIEITVPLGPINDRSDRPNLLSNYRGPGASMLSNLRLNVSVEFGEKVMVFRLLPRSATGMVGISRVREASFSLGLVRVNGWGRKVKVRVAVREYWERMVLRYWIDVPLVPM